MDDEKPILKVLEAMRDAARAYAGGGKTNRSVAECVCYSMGFPLGVAAAHVLDSLKDWGEDEVVREKALAAMFVPLIGTVEADIIRRALTRSEEGAARVDLAEGMAKDVIDKALEKDGEG